ncbi:MAG: MerR family transcriptional regulator [Candidatus Delongbacteria bacterium]
MDLIKQRLYYSIGEVSEILRINASTIRYWEKRFPILKPAKRTGHSKRKFDLYDIQTLFKIKTVLKKDNLSISRAVAELKVWTPSYSFEQFYEILQKANRPVVSISADKLDRINRIISEVRYLLSSIR